MVLYKIIIKKSVEKELRAIPKDYLIKIVKKIGSLNKSTRPENSEKLSNEEKYRIRQGPYRIIYSIDDNKKEIVIVKVGHRRDVYQH